MILTFVVHSVTRPVGGVVALYEYANAMSRRGHDVTIVHARWGHDAVEGLRDLEWFTFEPNVGHWISNEVFPEELPQADVIFNYGRGSSAAGLPVGVIQGYGMFQREHEDRAFRVPWPKICVARWLVEVGSRMGVPARQLVHVPCGIDHEKYRVVMPIESRPMQVAMLYHSHHQKGSKVGLAAIAEVQRRIPDLRVRVFGTCDPEEPLDADVEYLKLPSQDVIVNEIYNESRVFLCSSIVEGFGFCSVEAMACGCALVTTANGGSDDFAVHGETALVVEPSDAAALADHVEALLRDEERRIAIAHRGEQRAASFDWDRSAEMLEEFLESYARDPDFYRT